MAINTDIEIRFAGMTDAEASTAAQAFQADLTRRFPEEIDQVELLKADPNAMNMGDVLTVLLAAPAVVELAKDALPFLSNLAEGAFAFLKKRSSPTGKCIVTLADGTHLEITGNAEDLKAVLARLPKVLDAMPAGGGKRGRRS